MRFYRKSRILTALRWANLNPSEYLSFGCANLRWANSRPARINVRANLRTLKVVKQLPYIFQESESIWCQQMYQRLQMRISALVIHNLHGEQTLRWILVERDQYWESSSISSCWWNRLWCHNCDDGSKWSSAWSGMPFIVFAFIRVLEKWLGR